MSVLPNGTVLPHGLLSVETQAMMAGFNKTYRNYSLKAGFITAVYPKDSDKNIGKFVTEYDVLVIEQEDNTGMAPILYRRCVAIDGIGGIADYFEAQRRPVKKQRNNKKRDLKDQNGTLVLLLCLNGNGNSGVIIGGLTHPDRGTKIKGEGPQLYGSYNGIDIQILPDGSAQIKFRGATDNDGAPIDKTQGTTSIDIEKDGTFQIKHQGVTQRLQKDGNASLTAEKNISMGAKGNIAATSEGDINLESKGKTSQKMSDLIINATGSASAKCQTFELAADSELSMKASQAKIEASSMMQVKSSQIVLDGMTFCGGSGGTPAVILSTKGIGVGNLGAPVMVNFIGPFATKTFIK